MGFKLKTPIAIASTAFHKMAHSDGEVGSAAAAEKVLNTPFLLSNWATTSNEEVARACPNSLKLF